MVLIFVSTHPILNGAVGTGGFFASCIPSFNITTFCLKRNDTHNRDYEQVKIDNQIIITDDDSSVTYQKITHYKKRKVNFKNVVNFRTLPEYDKKENNRLWWQKADYENFRKTEIQRQEKEPRFNLQKMMAEQEENKHLENLLEKMQEKEHQDELERNRREQE